MIHRTYTTREAQHSDSPESSNMSKKLVWFGTYTTVSDISGKFSAPSNRVVPRIPPKLTIDSDRRAQW